MLLAVCAQASAAGSGHAAGTLAAVAPSPTQQLSSTAGPTVQRVVAAATPTVPPAANVQPAAASPRQLAPASSVVSRQPSEAHGAGVVAVAREAGERIVAASGAGHVEGHAPIQTVLHTATAAGGALRAVPVPGVLRNVTPARAGEVVRVVTHAVADAASSTHVVQTLTSRASALTATVAHTTHLGETVGHLTGSVSRPVGATLQTIGQASPAHPTAPGQQRTRAWTPASAVTPRPPAAALPLGVPSPTLASPSPLAGVASSAAGSLLGSAAAPALSALPGWSAWAPAASAGGPAASGPAGGLWTTLLDRSGRSAASSRARGAHPAPLPASPPPTPSPGGVSPATVVGPAAGLSIVLALAALVMLAAPPAVRRLRLDGESWRLAPLQLIADRPG